MRKLMTSAVMLSLFMLFGSAIQAEDYGIASFYSDSFQGRKTASGEPYDKNKLTAAHKTYPYGTILKVTRLDNKKSVRVRVNDRGPYIKGRIVDLSRKAAERLDLIADGHAQVMIEVVTDAREAVVDVPEPPKKEEIVKEVMPTPPPAAKEEPKPTDFDKTIAKPAPEEESVVMEEIKKTNVRPTQAPKKKTSTKPAAATSAPQPKKKEVKYRMAKGSDYQPYDLYKIEIQRPERQGYGVQVYSISNYENVIKQIAELQEKWFKNVLVSVEKGKDGKPSYKIILGPFEDRATADSYKKQLKKKKKINGFVVDLSAIDYPKQ